MRDRLANPLPPLGLVCALVILGLTAPPAAGAAAWPPGPCQPDGLDEEVRCGRYEVFEDRAAGKGRTLELAVVVLPATGPERAPDPVVFLAGGPGDSVVRQAAGRAGAYPAIREHRDFVLIDVRGTGESGSLLCGYQRDPGSPLARMSEFLPPDGVRACRDEWAGRTDLRLYTTPIAVDDLAEVLQALGYRSVNLSGASYGTRLALVFARRHPEMVRTLSLAGPAPPGVRLPLTFARDAQTALDGLLAECAAEEACAQAFPDPSGDLRRALEILDERAAKGRAAQAPDSLSRISFAQTLRYMLYLPASAQEIPLGLRLAAAGDFSVFSRYAGIFGGLLGGIPDGLFLSVTCAEDVPFIREEEIAAAVAGTFLGDYRIRQQQAACALWPRGEVPAEYSEPIRSAAPTLVVVGERDPATPVAWAREVAAALPHSRLVVVPNGGHEAMGLEGTECLDGLDRQLLESGSVDGIDPRSCLAGIRRPPFPTEPPAKAIQLPEEALRRLEGIYAASDSPMEIRIELRDGADWIDLGGSGKSFRLDAISPTRFQLGDLPPGFEVEIVEDGGEVSGLRLSQPGGEPMVLTRRGDHGD